MSKVKKETSATEAADKEKAAQAAEAYKMQQEAAEKIFRADQGKVAAKIGQALLAESTGGTAAAIAVGLPCWQYVNAEVIRVTGSSKPERFTDAVRQLKKDVAARLCTEATPNISRYLGFVGLCKLWDADKVSALPKSIVQEALPLITRDDTAPGLEYEELTPRGKETQLAYSWVAGCEGKGIALLEKALAGVGTCQAMTLEQFATERKAIYAGGQGRKNQGGRNKGDKKAGKDSDKKAASKAAAKLAQAIAAIKAYANVAAVPYPVRLKGLKTVLVTVRELATELKDAVSKPGKETAKETVKPAA